MKVAVKAKNQALAYDIAPGEKLLHAGLRAEVALPYECSTGTCGCCKARLLSGQVKNTWPEAPGQLKFKPGGNEILLCQCEAQTDLEIEIAGSVYYQDSATRPPLYLDGRIGEARLLNPEVIALRIDLDQAIRFDAGQYMLVELPGVPGFRGYSMTNWSRETRTLEFVIKRLPGGGCSEKLFNEPVEGLTVRLVGPLGTATFYPSMKKNLLCIAGGSGIAGMMSILECAASQRYFDQYQGYVFFGIRTFADRFLLEELAAYSAQFKKLSVTVAFSREAPPPSAAADYPGLTFTEGFVHEVALQALQGRFNNLRAYLAGPPPAVDAAMRMLMLEAKLTPDNIRFDKFS